MDRFKRLMVFVTILGITIASEENTVQQKAAKVVLSVSSI